MSIATKREQCSHAEQAYGILKARAISKHGTMSYPDLMGLLGYKHPGQLAPILALVMEECKEKGEPLYPALVVNREGIPGEGFFKQARGLGYKIEQDPEAEHTFLFWQFQRMGLFETIYEAQKPPESIWSEQKSLLTQLGYQITFEPLYPNAPNAQSLKGKRLVMAVKCLPDATFSPLNAVLEEDPKLRREFGAVVDSNLAGLESLQRIRKLRRELQAAAYSHMQKTIPIAGLVQASQLPSGDGPETASGLPS